MTYQFAQWLGALRAWLDAATGEFLSLPVAIGLFFAPANYSVNAGCQGTVDVKQICTTADAQRVWEKYVDRGLNNECHKLKSMNEK